MSQAALKTSALRVEQAEPVAGAVAESTGVQAAATQAASRNPAYPLSSLTAQEAQTLQQQYLREILLSPVYQAAVETPLQAMPKLAQRLGHHVFLKREDHQPVYSFKLRGAFHKLHKVAAKATAAGT